MVEDEEIKAKVGKQKAEVSGALSTDGRRGTGPGRSTVIYTSGRFTSPTCLCLAISVFDSLGLSAFWELDWLLHMAPLGCSVFFTPSRAPALHMGLVSSLSHSPPCYVCMVCMCVGSGESHCD